MLLACADGTGLPLGGNGEDHQDRGFTHPDLALALEGFAQDPIGPGQTDCVRDHVRLGSELLPGIQEALDQAESGQVLTLCDGIFHESLHLTRDIVLQSEHGLGFTFLVGNQDQSVISTEGAAVTLVGLDITSGGGNLWKDPLGGTVRAGGGVYAADAPLLRLENVRLHHNQAALGGGLFTADVERVELVGVELTANTATERGGGAMLAGGEILAENVWARLGESQSGGGLALEQAIASFNTVVVEDNLATDKGGGLALTTTELVLQNVTLQRNTADYGAAVHLAGGSLVADETTALTDNTGGTSGGGVFARESEVLLVGSTLSGNQADHGGAAYLLGGSAVFRGASLHANNAYRGGGLYITEEASVHFEEDTWVFENTAEAWAGGLAIFGEATLEADHATIAANVAPYGGGLLASEVTCRFGPDTEVRDNIALVGGGGLYANAARLEGSGMLVSGNEAPLGAGVLLEVDAEYVARGDRIVDNRAATGAGLLLYNGGLAWFEDVEVSRNTATEQAGGAWLDQSAGGLGCLDCNWGDGAEDNGPEDIVASDTAYAAPATFTCGLDGCQDG